MIHTVPFPHVQSSDHFSSLPMSHARSNPPPPPPPPPPSNKPQCAMCRRKRKRGAAAKRGRGWNLPTPRLHQHGPTTHPPGIGPSLTDPPPKSPAEPSPLPNRSRFHSFSCWPVSFLAWPGLVCMYVLANHRISRHETAQLLWFGESSFRAFSFGERPGPFRFDEGGGAIVQLRGVCGGGKLVGDLFGEGFPSFAES